MKTTSRIVIVLATCALIWSGSALAGGLDGFLKELDVEANLDLGAFKANLSASFGVSESKVSGLFEVMSEPADVYMTLRIGEVARRPLEQVVAEHKRSKGQGWGVIAKNLGIKPGSAEFHALKESRLGSKSGAASSRKPSKGKR